MQQKSKASKSAGAGSPSLQSIVGNQEYGKMLMSNIQAKLTVGSPNDVYEKEADAVAEKVVNMTDAQVQSKEVETPEIQAKGSSGGMEVPAGFESGLNGIKGTGAPLNKQFREGMESRLNTYLGDVRVHTGSRADKLARSINAEAFTAGHDIVFAARNGRNLDSRAGKKLLGHELTHVLQQRKGVQRKTPEIQAKIYISDGSNYAFENKGEPVEYTSEDLFLTEINYWHRSDFLRAFHGNYGNLYKIHVEYNDGTGGDPDAVLIDAPSLDYYIIKDGKRVSVSKFIEDDKKFELTCQVISVAIDLASDIITIVRLARATKAFSVLKALKPGIDDLADVKNFEIEKSTLRSLAECVPFLGTALGIITLSKGAPKASGLKKLQEHDKKEMGRREGRKKKK
ncbi:MAG: DUF4157 domain-containing protein [bacterium]|nr:DUF4157 domain-containing protein [bacterium]